MTFFGLKPPRLNPLKELLTEVTILPSNFASQQTLLRTPDGLSEITGDLE